MKANPPADDPVDPAFGGSGALLALLIIGNELSIIALIGIILLIGIVKKNAIMMIDFAIEAERNEGLSPEEAIYQACLLRFRPIMMTTMAALFGAFAARARPAGSAPSCASRSASRSSGDCSCQPDADAVHDAGHLHLLRQTRTALRQKIKDRWRQH